MKRKALSVMLIASMTAAMLSACGNSNDSASAPATTPAKEDTAKAEESTAAGTETEASAAEATELDMSERVDLVFYVMGDAPTDEQLVEDALNELLLEKCNATVDFQFSTWTDFQQKYSLEITSGNADLIYIANWLNYGQLAASGAFEELDDLLNTVSPALKEAIGENSLNMCSVNGCVYAIPNTWPEYVSNGLKYREDLREKYDLPVPNTLENFEAYLLGIKENEPNQGLLTVTAEESQGMQTAFDAACIFNMKYPWVYNNGLPYGLAANYDTPDQVYDYWWSDDFVEDMKLMKKWADLGFWSKSALSDTNDSEAYQNGLCVAEIAGQNPNKQITAIQQFATDHPDWKSEFIAYGETTGVIYPGHATQNGTAIVRGCKNPERAMKVLETLMLDQEVNNLVEYGIEGTHYEVVDGVYNNLSDTFPYEAFNTWALRNGDYKLPQSTDVELQKMFDEYAVMGEQTKFPNVNIYDGFSEDYEAYSAERSAVSNVLRQYLAPIQAGQVADVEAAVEEFRQKMIDAGIETCREGFKEQWQAYCDTYGYH